MDYTIEKLINCKYIGFVKTFEYKTCQTEVPKFWKEIFGKLAKKDDNDIEYKTMIECNICEYGISFDYTDTTFKYMLGGTYKGGEIPKGMEIYEIKEAEVAKFKIVGPMPQSHQELHKKVFDDWIINNGKYKFTEQFDMEFFPKGDMKSEKYENEIWIPITKI